MLRALLIFLSLFGFIFVLAVCLSFVIHLLTRATPPATEAMDRLERERAALSPDSRARSRALLEGTLTPTQLATFRMHRYIPVRGSKSRDAYLIFEGREGNIKRFHEGKPVRYCAVPRYTLPLYDAMLAQKTMIELNEDEFLRVANG